MTRFVDIKSVQPKLRQDQIATELGCSSSTLQRYRQDQKMLLPYGILSNRYKRRQNVPNTTLDKNSRREHDIKTHQMTSKDLK